jgi:hypothetical protein
VSPRNFAIGDKVKWDLWILIRGCAPLPASRVGRVVHVAPDAISVEYLHGGERMREAMPPSAIRHFIEAVAP